jgi:uncharacterized damage-inducible protein DinB
MVRLEKVLETWQTIRNDTAQAVEDFPTDNLDYRPVDELATFEEIARHILDVSHGLTGILLAGEENLATPDFREKLKQYMVPLPEKPDRVALGVELRKQLAIRVEELRRQPPEFYAKIITRFDGQQFTRLEMLQFVKEHELTHRQQLFMYLRLKGIVPATTRRRLAAAKR